MESDQQVLAEQKPKTRLAIVYLSSCSSLQIAGYFAPVRSFERLSRIPRRATLQRVDTRCSFSENGRRREREHVPLSSESSSSLAHVADTPSSSPLSSSSLRPLFRRPLWAAAPPVPPSAA